MQTPGPWSLSAGWQKRHACLLAAFLSLLVPALAFPGQPQAVLVEQTYDWGTVWLSAGESDTLHIGDTDLIVYTKDVRADLRLSDGRRLLIATGRLELAPKTGDFTASAWPFLYYFRTAENSGTFSANTETDSIQFHAGELRLRAVAKKMIPPPDILKARESQLDELKKRP